MKSHLNQLLTEIFEIKGNEAMYQYNIWENMQVSVFPVCVLRAFNILVQYQQCYGYPKL